MGVKNQILAKLADANGHRRTRLLDLADVAEVVRDARRDRSAAHGDNGGRVANAYGYASSSTVVAAYTGARGTTSVLIGVGNGGKGASNGGPLDNPNWGDAARRRQIAKWLRFNRGRFVRVPKGSRVA